MHITILNLLTFLASICFIFGVWQFLWIIIHKKGYEMDKLENESFPDFLFRYYEDEWIWRLRKRIYPKWFMHSKLFFIFIKIRGVILILGGIVISIGIYFLLKSEYAPWLYIEI